MHNKLLIATALPALVFLSCNNPTEVKKTAFAWPENIQAPVAEIKPKELVAHGDTRIDNYY